MHAHILSGDLPAEVLEEFCRLASTESQARLSGASSFGYIAFGDPVRLHSRHWVHRLPRLRALARAYFGDYLAHLQGSTVGDLQMAQADEQMYDDDEFDGISFETL